MLILKRLDELDEAKGKFCEVEKEKKRLEQKGEDYP